MRKVRLNMRKVALICGLIALIIGCLSWFYQKQEVEDKEQMLIEQETEKYKQDCFNQSYPKDLSSINMIKNIINV